MNTKLHQARQEKLESLMRMNEKLIKFYELLFFETEYSSALSKEAFIKLNRSKSLDVLRDVRNGMFDSQFEIQSMINAETNRVALINEQRKKASTHQSKALKEEVISEEYIEDLTRFQALLNLVYERAIR